MTSHKGHGGAAIAYARTNQSCGMVLQYKRSQCDTTSYKICTNEQCRCGRKNTGATPNGTTFWCILKAQYKAPNDAVPVIFW